MSDIVPTNYYTIMPAKYKKAKATYPNYNKIKIDLPMRMLIIGTSGAGKTNCVLDMIKHINAWSKIYLFAKNANQGLYNWLQQICEKVSEKTGEQVLFVSENTDDIPSIDEIDGEEPALYIFDDLICESKSVLKRIGDLYVQGRHKLVSLIFLSQAYFEIDKLIRKNANYIVIKKVLSTKDFGRMLAEYKCSEMSEQQFLTLHDKIVKRGMENWAMVDLNTDDPELKYRFNFGPISALDATQKK